MSDHYSLLGLSYPSTLEEIRKAYRKLSLKYHPDKTSDPDHHHLFLKISSSYAILSLPLQKQKYDASLSASPFRQKARNAFARSDSFQHEFGMSADPTPESRRRSYFGYYQHMYGKSDQVYRRAQEERQRLETERVKRQQAERAREAEMLKRRQRAQQDAHQQREKEEALKIQAQLARLAHLARKQRDEAEEKVREGMQRELTEELKPQVNLHLESAHIDNLQDFQKKSCLHAKPESPKSLYAQFFDYSSSLSHMTNTASEFSGFISGSMNQSFKSNHSVTIPTNESRDDSYLNVKRKDSWNNSAMLPSISDSQHNIFRARTDKSELTSEHPSRSTDGCTGISAMPPNGRPVPQQCHRTRYKSPNLSFIGMGTGETHFTASSTNGNSETIDNVKEYEIKLSIPTSENEPVDANPELNFTKPQISSEETAFMLKTLAKRIQQQNTERTGKRYALYYEHSKKTYQERKAESLQECDWQSRIISTQPSCGSKPNTPTLNFDLDQSSDTPNHSDQMPANTQLISNSVNSSAGSAVPTNSSINCTPLIESIQKTNQPTQFGTPTKKYRRSSHSSEGVPPRNPKVQKKGNHEETSPHSKLSGSTLYDALNAPPGVRQKSTPKLYSKRPTLPIRSQYRFKIEPTVSDSFDSSINSASHAKKLQQLDFKKKKTDGASFQLDALIFSLGPDLETVQYNDMLESLPGKLTDSNTSDHYTDPSKSVSKRARRDPNVYLDGTSLAETVFTPINKNTIRGYSYSISNLASSDQIQRHIREFYTASDVPVPPEMTLDPSNMGEYDLYIQSIETYRQNFLEFRKNFLHALMTNCNQRSIDCHLSLDSPFEFAAHKSSVDQELKFQKIYTELLLQYRNVMATYWQNIQWISTVRNQAKKYCSPK